MFAVKCITHIDSIGFLLVLVFYSIMLLYKHVHILLILKKYKHGNSGIIKYFKLCMGNLSCQQRHEQLSQVLSMVQLS